MNTVNPVKVFFALPFLGKIILLIFFISTLGIGWGLFWLYLLLFGVDEDTYKKIKIQTLSKKNQNNFFKNEALNYDEIKNIAYKRKQDDDFFKKENERFKLDDYITLIEYERVNEIIPIEKSSLKKAKIIKMEILNNFDIYDFSITKQNIYSNDEIKEIAIKRKDMDDFFKTEEEKFALDEYITLIKNEPQDKVITISKIFLDLIKLRNET